MKKILNIFKKKKKEEKKPHFNPYERKDGDKMTEIEKMDKGFNGKTYTINGIEYDF